MAFTYVVGTARGRVRLLIPDKDDIVAANQLFTDAEIDDFLAMESDSVRRATALALETIASNQALTLKVIKLLDLQTDGAKTSDALLKRATLLRTQADADDAATGELFDVAELVYNDWAAQERVEKEALRSG